MHGISNVNRESFFPFTYSRGIQEQPVRLMGNRFGTNGSHTYIHAYICTSNQPPFRLPPPPKIRLRAAYNKNEKQMTYVKIING